MAFRSFALLSVLVPAALAQFIPSGISDKCTAFLSSLNNDTDFLPCTVPFTTNFAQFAPGSPASDANAISSALGSFCQSSRCSQSMFSSRLGSFYAACSTELTSSPNEALVLLYDSLYALWPVSQALCSKDNNGTFCATENPSPPSAGSAAFVDPEKSQQQNNLDQYLYSSGPTSPVAARDVSNSSSAAFFPNATTWGRSNLLFFGREPSWPASTLCTACTRNIMTPYITFGSNCPYAPGMSNSELLAGQVALYNNITSKCGQSFFSGAVQAAGGLSSGYLSGAAPLAVGEELSTAFGAILGLAAFVVASL